jgi:hypothetical protein
MKDYRRLEILQLLQGSQAAGVPHEILADELERLLVPGTDQDIRDDAAYLQRAQAIAIDQVGANLVAYRLLLVGEEHLKRKRALAGVSKPRWKHS